MGISAKAKRKVAREIKTARAFGLMPFTTMGTKSFVFGKSIENLDEDYEHETFDSGMAAGADETILLKAKLGLSFESRIVSFSGYILAFPMFG